MPYSKDEQVTDVEFIGVGDADAEMDEKTAEFFQRMKEASNGATLVVLRVLTNGKSPHEHIEEIPVERYEWGEMLEYLRQTYGGGEYRIQLREGGAIRKWANVVIAKPLNNNNNLPAAPRGNDQDLVRGLLDRMDNLQTQLLQKNSGSEMEFLEKMKIYKDLFAQPPGDTSSGLKQMTEMLGFFDRLGIGFEKDSGPKGLEAFAPVIGKLIDAGEQQALRVPQRPAQNPHHLGDAQKQAQNNAQENEPQKEVSQTELEKLAFRIELEKLARAADGNKDPGIYAQVICDQLQTHIVKHFFVEENWIDRISEKVPAIKNYPQWMALLSEHVKAILGMESAVSHEYQSNENNNDDLTEKPGDDKTSPNDAA